MSNAHYWANKETRSQFASTHTQEMDKFYKEEINSCISRSRVIRSISSSKHTNKPNFLVTENDSVSEIFAQDYIKGVVLNFASYKNPGGGFLKGSSAQEESLCMDSYLYNVLRNFKDYYEYNQKHLNDGLYTNAAIYTPSVLFFKGDSIKYCDVLTCASPNFSLSERYGSFTKEENSSVLLDRIIFMRDIIDSSDADTAILGAWGCGVFRQDPYEVAKLFKEVFSKTRLTKIVFAIPSSRHSKANYNAFKSVFSC